MHSLTLSTRTYIHDTYYVYTAKLPYYNTNIRTYVYTYAVDIHTYKYKYVLYLYPYMYKHTPAPHPVCGESHVRSVLYQ